MKHPYFKNALEIELLQEQLNNELKELQEAYQKEKSQVPSKNRGINADTTDCYKVFYSRVLQQKAKDLEI